MNPRPSPDEVSACFEQDLGDEALRAYLAVIAADPNWTVFSTPLGNKWRITLLYAPTGIFLEWHYERHDSTGAVIWRLVQP